MERERPRKVQSCLSPQQSEPVPREEKLENVSAQVSNSSQVCNLLSQLKALVSNFRAGNVANCILQWQALTSDPEILQIVRGDVINFEGNPPANSIARNCNVSADTEARMNKEIRDMLEKGIIVPSSYEQGEYMCLRFSLSLSQTEVFASF